MVGRSRETQEGRLHLKVFETKNIEACIEYIRANIPCAGMHVAATGGGAHKFAGQYFMATAVVDFQKICSSHPWASRLIDKMK